jgi:hypothetical protein
MMMHGLADFKNAVNQYINVNILNLSTRMNGLAIFTLQLSCHQTGDPVTYA